MRMAEKEVLSMVLSVIFILCGCVFVFADNVPQNANNILYSSKNTGLGYKGFKNGEIFETAITQDMGKGNIGIRKTGINSSFVSDTRTGEYNTTGSSIDSSTAVNVFAGASQESSVPEMRILMGNVSAVGSNRDIQIPVTVKNISGIAVKNAVLTIKTDEGIYVSDGKVSKSIGDIAANSSELVYFNLKTADVITKNVQEVEITLKYGYKVRNQMLSKTESESFYIPVVPDKPSGKSDKLTDRNGEPIIRITKSGIDSPIGENMDFNFNITVSNNGTTDIKNCVLSLSGSREIVFLNNTDTFIADSIKAGKTKTFTVYCRTMKGITSSSQIINVRFEYGYKSGRNDKSAITSVKIIVPTIPSETVQVQESTVSAPSVVVDGFDYGGQSVASGKSFTLNIKYKNTGKLPVENLVVSVESDGNVQVSSGEGTFYSKLLSPGEIYSQDVEMTVLPTAQSGEENITVSFDYEYDDGTETNQATSTESISVPVYKTDLMEITPVQTDETAVVGEEYRILLDYANKGDTLVSNLKAELTGDSVECLETVQNLGSVQAGEFGTAAFVVTPLNTGDNNIEVRFTYENSDGENKERIFTFTVNAEGSYYDNLYNENKYEQKETPTLNPRFVGGGIGMGIIAVGAAVYFIIRYFKKKKGNL